MKTLRNEKILGVGRIKEVETVNGGKVLVFEDAGRNSMNDVVDYIVGDLSAVRAYMITEVIPCELAVMAEQLDSDNDTDYQYPSVITDVVKNLIDGYDQAEAINKIYDKETADQAIADFEEYFPEWAGTVYYDAPGSHPCGNAYLICAR